MKKITLGCSVLAVAILFAVGCNKKTNTPPPADTESTEAPTFKTSKDAVYATSAITDLEIICSYIGDRSITNTNFLAPGNTGNCLISNDTTNKILTATWTNSCLCKDGKKRNGTISLTYTASTQSAKFYRQPFWVGEIKLNNYQVDGWLIDDVTPMKITNKMAGSYNPGTEALNWDVTGDFTIDNIADATLDLTWKGTFNKKLSNSTTASVFNPNKLYAIVWATSTLSPTGATIEYICPTTSSVITGFTSASKNYSFTIDPNYPLQRNFACTPDKVLGVVSSVTVPISITPVYSEWHPFVNGIASFTTSGITDPRLIKFGAEDGSVPCDNAGTVTIKGVSYPLDFTK